jgi:hypothetical protein
VPCRNAGWCDVAEGTAASAAVVHSSAARRPRRGQGGSSVDAGGACGRRDGPKRPAECPAHDGCGRATSRRISPRSRRVGLWQPGPRFFLGTYADVWQPSALSRRSLMSRIGTRRPGDGTPGSRGPPRCESSYTEPRSGVRCACGPVATVTGGFLAFAAGDGEAAPPAGDEVLPSEVAAVSGAASATARQPGSRDHIEADARSWWAVPPASSLSSPPALA